MFFAALLSVTLIPALAILLIKGRIRSDNSRLNKALKAVYAPVVEFAVRWRWPVIILALLALVATVLVYPSLGNEFMPPFNEGSILYMPTTCNNLSVAVVVGMIAMAGLSVELGLLMMLYLDLAWRRHTADGSLKTSTDLMNTIAEGASQRIRPMLMTSLTLFLGLLPIMYSSGSGADVMKRIATPMLGGASSTLILVLIVFPAIFLLWRDNQHGKLTRKK